MGKNNNIIDFEEDYDEISFKEYKVGRIIKYTDCRPHTGHFLIVEKNKWIKFIHLETSEMFESGYNKDRIRKQFFDRM